MKTQIWPDLELNMSSGCVSPERIKETKQDPYGSLEQELNFLKTCNRAYNSALENNYSEMNVLIQKIGSNRKITNKKLEIKLNKPFDFLSEFTLQTGYSSSHDELNPMNHCKHELNSKDRLVKQDSFAVCEPRSGELARQAQRAEPWLIRLGLIGDTEWYPQGNSNPCCTDENRVS